MVNQLLTRNTLPSAASGEEEVAEDPTRLVNISEVFASEAGGAEGEAKQDQAAEANAVEPAAEAEHVDEAGQEENAYVDFQETADLDTKQAEDDAEYVDYQDTVALGTNLRLRTTPSMLTSRKLRLWAPTPRVVARAWQFKLRQITSRLPS